MYNFIIKMRGASTMDRIALEGYLLSNETEYHYLNNGNVKVCGASKDVYKEVTDCYICYEV